MSALKCVQCGNDDLYLSVGYDGMDYHSEAGEGSGFSCEVTLECPHCGRVYIIGRVKRSSDFAIDIDAQHFAREGVQTNPAIIYSQRLIEQL